MKNNWRETFDEQFKPSYAYPFVFDEQCNTDVKDFIESLLAEQKKELMEEERQFILNILDGIDIADKQMGVMGGTQAIRQALKNRVI